jgi:DNA-binding transcriptional ArsR family regulator
MPDESDGSSFDRSRAELFDALGHPVRIKILHALEDGPLGFSELRRRVGLESGGHLQFHLSRLSGLVQTSASGDYALTDDGRDALRIVGSAETSGRGISREEVRRNEVRLSRALLAALLAAMVLVGSLAVVQQLQIASQQSEIRNQQKQIQNLLNEIKIINSTAVDSPFSLQLRLTVNGTTFRPNQTVQVTARVFNPLGRMNNVSAEGDWPSPFGSDACQYEPMAVQTMIFQGYYTDENISTARSIEMQWWYLATCISIPGPYFWLEPYLFAYNSSYLVFRPSSSVATLDSGGQVTVEENVTAYAMRSFRGITVDNVTIITHTSFSLGQGVYTAAAGDQWGHLAIEHFTISP